MAEAKGKVLLLNSGDVDRETVSGLMAQYPWLQVRHIDVDRTLYASKMDGARMATGDIVVLWDADCTYCEDWLLKAREAFVRDYYVVRDVDGGSGRLRSGHGSDASFPALQQEDAALLRGYLLRQ